MVMSVLQPNLVLCLESDGRAAVEYACCGSLHASGSAPKDSSVFTSLDHHCNSCVDVPVSMLAVRVGTPATGADAMSAGTLLSALFALPLDRPKAHPLATGLVIARGNDPRLSAIQSTVLLI